LPYFQVEVESLQGAAARLLPGGAFQAMGSAGSAAGTPVAGAWAEFVRDADRALRSSEESLMGLSHALGLAARR
jgi:hypothetical protein